MRTRVVIISCGKAKLDHPAPARELYTGSLFRAARAYAEASGHPWAILSALHGVVDPKTVLEPYDLTRNLSPKEAGIALRQAKYLAFGVPPSREPTIYERGRASISGVLVEVELHAGARYAEPIQAVRRVNGVVVVCPLEGLQVGERLRWYAQQRGKAQAGPIQAELFQEIP